MLVMRHILSHIIALFILLSVVGVKVMDTTQVNYSFQYLGASHGVDNISYTIKGEVQKRIKEYRADNSFSSIETDNSDDVHTLDQLVLLAILVKVFVCAIFIHFVLFAYRRRRSFYEALIQLFDHKYIVYHTLRI